MKDFLKRWIGTVGVVLMVIGCALVVGAMSILRELGWSPAWVFLPMFGVLFWTAIKADRHMQKVRREEWGEK